MLELAVRFLIGAAVVAVSLRVSDAVDARLGGVLGGVPKTSAVALLVVAVEHGGAFAAETAANSLYGIGAVLLYTTAFALAPRALPGRPAGPWRALAAAGAVYAALVAPYLAGWVDGLGLAGNLAVAATAYAVATVLLARARDLAPDDGTGPSPDADAPAAAGARRWVVRYGVPSVVAGTLVVAATLAADHLGPVWGGIAAVFPANVTTLLVSGAVLFTPQAAFEQAAGIPDGVAAAGVFLLALVVLLPLVHVALAGLLAYLAWGAAAWTLGRTPWKTPAGEPAADAPAP